MIKVFVLSCLVTFASGFYNNYSVNLHALYEFESEEIEEIPALAPSLPGQGKCNLHHLEFCQKQFIKTVRAKDDIFKKIPLFFKLLSDFYDRPITQGLLSICAARDEFQSCLGTEYHACTDFFNIYKHQDLKFKEAFQLADIYNDMEFDCNAGLAQSTRHWDCIQKVHASHHYAAHINECTNQYNYTISENPAAYCRAAEGFSFCVAISYQVEPQCMNKETLWWECERLLRRAQLDGFCNSISCHKVFVDFEDDDLYSKNKGLSYGEQKKYSLIRPEQKEAFKQIADLFRSKSEVSN